MYDGASNGGRVNNDKFSPCSIRAIIETLKLPKVRRPLQKDVIRSRELLCLELPERIIERRPRCGDTIVQHHEQCDCGTLEECKISDPGGCCNPKTCRLRKGAYCSVADGKCMVDGKYISNASTCVESCNYNTMPCHIRLR